MSCHVVSSVLVARCIVSQPLVSYCVVLRRDAPCSVGRVVSRRGKLCHGKSGVVLRQVMFSHVLAARVMRVLSCHFVSCRASPRVVSWLVGSCCVASRQCDVMSCHVIPSRVTRCACCSYRVASPRVLLCCPVVSNRGNVMSHVV